MKNKYKGIAPKKCAVILKDDRILKIYDYSAIYKQLNSDPSVIIYEDCDQDKLDEKAAYWERIVNYDFEKNQEYERELMKKLKLNDYEFNK